MTVARSTVNELTLTFGTVLEPELPPDGVADPPQAAAKRPTLHNSDTAPPIRWRPTTPDPNIAVSLSSVRVDCDRHRWTRSVSHGLWLRLRDRLRRSTRSI